MEAPIWQFTLTLSEKRKLVLHHTVWWCGMCAARAQWWWWYGVRKPSTLLSTIRKTKKRKNGFFTLPALCVYTHFYVHSGVITLSHTLRKITWECVCECARWRARVDTPARAMWARVPGLLFVFSLLSKFFEPAESKIESGRCAGPLCCTEVWKSVEYIYCRSVWKSGKRH